MNPIREVLEDIRFRATICSNPAERDLWIDAFRTLERASNPVVYWCEMAIAACVGAAIATAVFVIAGG